VLEIQRESPQKSTGDRGPKLGEARAPLAVSQEPVDFFEICLLERLANSTGRK